MNHSKKLTHSNTLTPSLVLWYFLVFVDKREPVVRGKASGQPKFGGGLFSTGLCFGFVEFEIASSVQSAIEASLINIGGCNAVVEEKRSTSQGIIYTEMMISWGTNSI
ncbi:hypothetical protein V6N13_064320 [Hibiscus sabdariffa]